MQGIQSILEPRMSTAHSLFIAQMAKLRIAEGDFTLKCEGEIIKAHSFILRSRSTQNSVEGICCETFVQV